MNFLSDSREWRRFFKFSTVGVIGAAVDFAVFNVLLNLVGLQPLVCQALSFLAAVTSNFILNRHWTYPDSRSKPLRTQLAQYGLVNFIGLLIRTPMFNGMGTLLEKALSGREFPFGISSYAMAHNLALASAIGIVLFWNFFINRYWTYGDVE